MLRFHEFFEIFLFICHNFGEHNKQNGISGIVMGEHTRTQTWGSAKKGLNFPPQALASICTVVLLCITVYHIKYITRQARVRFQAPDDFFFHLFFNFCTFITPKPNLNKPNFNLNLT